MGVRVVFSCAAQERIPSIANTMALLATTSLFSYKGSSQSLSAPTSEVIGVAGPLTLHGGDTGLGLAAIP